MGATVAAVLLAAGQSQRFGANKLLQPLLPNMSVLEVAIDKYLRVFSTLSVVLPESHQGTFSALPGLLQPGVRTITCAEASAGMSQSLRAGVAANLQSDACLIGLADMPFVQIETLRAIKEQISADGIVQPAYKEQAGHPVAFGRAFFAELMGLEGDQGGRVVIQQNLQQRVLLETQDHGVIFDIDRPADLATGQRLFAIDA